jgi:hypothetical protein
MPPVLLEGPVDYVTRNYAGVALDLDKKQSLP